MKDYFSTYCTGMAVVDRQNWQRYEESPGHKFDQLLNDHPAVSLAKVCERTSAMSWVCHSPADVWGYFLTDMTHLKPLDDLSSKSYTRHLMAISTREEWRNWGFWRQTMEIIIEAAEEAGILLHGISRPFHMKWPEEIRNAEEMMWFLDNDHKFFSYIRNAKEEKRQSKRLLEKYREAGMCGFRYPHGNGFSTHAKRNRYGFAYMSSLAPQSMRQTFEPFMCC
jgi:GNAT superfamily N-acetyltransferase